MTWQTERRYRRLPGRPFTAFRRDSLWLAEDHLLSVQSSRFAEDYRRYYFRDVQAITIHRTAAVSPWTYLTGAVAAVLLAPGLFFEFQNAFLWFSGGLFLALTLSLIGLGPTCACYIQTAVSRDRLGSLRWIRAAENTLRILQPRIEEVQGPLTPEMLSLPSEPPLSGPFIQPPPLPTLKLPETGWGYEFLFAVLLVDSLHAYLGLSHRGTAMDVAAFAILITEIVSIVWLLIRQRRFEVPGSIRALVILALVATAGFTYAANVFSTVGRQLKPGSATYPGYVPLHVTDVAIYAVLGAAGLVLITRHRRSLRRPPPLAAPQ
jgi:hypothetical protein